MFHCVQRPCASHQQHLQCTQQCTQQSWTTRLMGQAATANAPTPDFSGTDSSFTSFEPVSEEFVSRLIRSLAKSCDLDPVPTDILKEFLDVLLPFLTRLCNSSIAEGCLPTSLKQAIVTLALKKHGLDTSELKNYRPISNLSFTSKLVETVVFSQLSAYLTEN